MALVGGWGPLAVAAGLFLLPALASQVMPNLAVAVLLAPIALNTANDLGVSPYPLMMVVVVSASAAFLSPVGHSANVLIIGPGGYRFADDGGPYPASRELAGKGAGVNGVPYFH